jgi:hypothetical protein
MKISQGRDENHLAGAQDSAERPEMSESPLAGSQPARPTRPVYEKGNCWECRYYQDCPRMKGSNCCRNQVRKASY